ncbi:MAG: hypothetical protein BGO43_06295 [Gammaproteobacteria bacterium 39-13]|nr:protein kinase family protein [Gammaproteobacteria bacterium]OJV90456.1 MAG: hypothetical protein BGO43_06295 [Gammaproteobacteria bacterium 39-13]
MKGKGVYGKYFNEYIKERSADSKNEQQKKQKIPFAASGKELQLIKEMEENEGHILSYAERKGIARTIARLIKESKSLPKLMTGYLDEKGNFVPLKNHVICNDAGEFYAIYSNPLGKGQFGTVSFAQKVEDFYLKGEKLFDRSHHAITESFSPKKKSSPKIIVLKAEKVLPKHKEPYLSQLKTTIVAMRDEHLGTQETNSIVDIFDENWMKLPDSILKTEKVKDATKGGSNNNREQDSVLESPETSKEYVLRDDISSNEAIPSGSIKEESDDYLLRDDVPVIFKETTSSESKKEESTEDYITADEAPVLVLPKETLSVSSTNEMSSDNQESFLHNEIDASSTKSSSDFRETSSQTKSVESSYEQAMAPEFGKTEVLDEATAPEFDKFNLKEEILDYGRAMAPEFEEKHREKTTLTTEPAQRIVLNENNEKAEKYVDNIFYLFMTKAEGVPLSEFMQVYKSFQEEMKIKIQKEPDVKKKKKMAREVMEIGLKIAFNITKITAALHQVNMVHNDIKADNVMISPRTLELTLIDYGLASSVMNPTNKTLLNIYLASLEMLKKMNAPESVPGKIPTSYPKDDFYALCLMLWTNESIKMYQKTAKILRNTYIEGTEPSIHFPSLELAKILKEFTGPEDDIRFTDLDISVLWNLKKGDSAQSAIEVFIRKLEDAAKNLDIDLSLSGKDRKLLFSGNIKKQGNQEQASVYSMESPRSPKIKPPSKR